MRYMYIRMCVYIHVCVCASGLNNKLRFVLLIVLFLLFSVQYLLFAFDKSTLTNQR